jgi:hypothetical protein
MDNNMNQIIIDLRELGDALYRQPTDWPGCGDTCYNAAELIESTLVKQDKTDNQVDKIIMRDPMVVAIVNINNLNIVKEFCNAHGLEFIVL